MRTVKFRAKALSDGKWVYGYVVRIDGKYYIFSEHIRQYSLVEVDPYTVGQYIGLKDNSNREIYDDDIVVYGLDRGLGVVKYINGTYCLEWYDKNGSPFIDHLLNFVGDVVVVGNIYDNPDLISEIKDKLD